MPGNTDSLPSCVLEYATLEKGCFLVEGRINGISFKSLFPESLPDGEYSFCEDGICSVSPACATISTGPWFPLSYKLPNARIKDGFGRSMTLLSSGRGIRIHRMGIFEQIRCSLLLSAELLTYRFPFGFLALLVRPCAIIAKLLLRRKRIWMFQDKTFGDTDNAYAVAYRVAMSDFGISPVYAAGHDINFAQPPPKRLLLVRPLSIVHRLLSFAAEVRVTSEDNYSPVAPYECYADFLWQQPVVWVTHGILYDDLSDFYRRSRQNYAMVTTGEPREDREILKQAWEYDSPKVVCSGKPRWDFLKNSRKNRIVLAFSWRHYLDAGNILASNYYRAISAVFADGRLAEAAREFGYELFAVVHPCFRNIDVFDMKSSFVQLIPEGTPYSTVFAEAVMLITDYSSVHTDVAILGKPVVFYQFDRDEFYARTPEIKPDFRWENEGAGAVFFKHDDLVEYLISMMKNGCTVQPEFVSRNKNFTVRLDGKCSERVISAIETMICRMHFQGRYDK